jgi:hypothetical protein
MKAMVKAKAEPGSWLEEVPVPKAGSDDVLIRVVKTSICGTDVHIYNWDAWARKAFIMDHKPLLTRGLEILTKNPFDRTYERFEDVPVWQEAARLYQAVEALLENKSCRGSLGFRDQLARAAQSVSNNIAEGFERLGS